MKRQGLGAEPYQPTTNDEKMHNGTNSTYALLFYDRLLYGVYYYIMKTKNKLSVGDKVEFHSGNFEGLTGEVIKEEYGKQFKPYGLRFIVKLSNSKIGYIEKSEHWNFI